MDVVVGTGVTAGSTGSGGTDKVVSGGSIAGFEAVADVVGGAVVVGTVAGAVGAAVGIGVVGDGVVMEGCDGADVTSGAAGGTVRLTILEKPISLAVPIIIVTR